MFYNVKKSHFNAYQLLLVVVVKSDLVDHAKKRNKNSILAGAMKKRSQCLLGKREKICNKINGLRVKSAVFYTGAKKNVIKSMVYV